MSPTELSYTCACTSCGRSCERGAPIKLSDKPCGCRTRGMANFGGVGGSRRLAPIPAQPEHRTLKGDLGFRGKP